MGDTERESSGERHLSSFVGGETFAGCVILSLLARGGMGAVYRARDGVGREVALKLIREDIADADALARFRREGEALARVPPHPNVVTVHSAGVERGRAFLVLPLVEGESIAAALKRGPFPIARAVAVAAGLARGVAHIHAFGVLHRDLKPANVLLREDEPDRPVIVDFGLAFTGEGGLTRTGELMGTPQYMSPEQAIGHGADPVDARTDVHAVGAILHELLTGRPAFTGKSTLEVVHRVLDPSRPDPRDERREVDAELAAIVRSAFARDLARRTPDAATLVRELDAWLAAHRAGGRSRRGAARPLAAAALAVAGLAAAVVASSGTTPPAPVPPPPPPPPSPRTPPPASPPPRVAASPIAGLDAAGYRDVLRAAEHFDTPKVQLLLKPALRQGLRLDDAGLQDALVRGLAAGAREPATRFAVKLDGLADLLAPNEAFRDASTKTVVAAIDVELDARRIVPAASLLLAMSRLGFRLAEAGVGERLLECFYNHYQDLPEDVRRRTWHDLLPAFVRLDIEVDNGLLGLDEVAITADDPASRFLRLRRALKVAQTLEPAPAIWASLAKLGDGDELGPRTRAHAHAASAWRENDFAARIAVLRRAAFDLDPKSSPRARDLAMHLSYLHWYRDAVAAGEESQRRDRAHGVRVYAQGDAERMDSSIKEWRAKVGTAEDRSPSR